jgi:hypothetical protein
MKSVMSRIACLGLVSAVLLGCGATELPYTDNSRDSAAFAKSVKEVVLSAAEELKTAKQPADAVRTIVEMLSELDVCPTGDHLKSYQEMHAIASDLLAKCEKGRPADMQNLLTQIAQLASALPGDVVVVKESGKER